MAALSAVALVAGVGVLSRDGGPSRTKDVQTVHVDDSAPDTTPHHSLPSYAGSTGLFLLAVRGIEVDRVSIDTKEWDTRDFGQYQANYSTLELDRLVGGTVVLATKGPFDVPPESHEALLLNDGDSLHPMHLGPADAIYPAVDPQQLWLSTTGQPGQSTILTRLVPGGGILETVHLPDYTAVPVGGQFLTNRRSTGTLNPGDGELGQDLVLVDAAGHVLRNLGQTPAEATSATQIAYLEPTCDKSCRLHVLNVVTGQDSAIVVPIAYWSGGVGTFSRDGRYLAMAGSDLSSQGALLIFDLRSRTARKVPGALSDLYNGFRASFSADGRWLAFVGSNKAELDVVDVTTGRAYYGATLDGAIDDVVSIS